MFEKLSKHFKNSFLDMAKPEVKDVRAELKKYGNEEPAKKFIEELKIRQKALSEKQNKVF